MLPSESRIATTGSQFDPHPRWESNWGGPVEGPVRGGLASRERQPFWSRQWSRYGARIVAVTGLGGVAWGATVVAHGAAMRPVLFALFGTLVIAVGALARAGNRPALLLAGLFGVPLNLPGFRGDPRSSIRNKASWLAQFMQERPRGFNTQGAHLVYGAVAVKRLLKTICVREEKDSSVLKDLLRRRTAVVAELGECSAEVSRTLAAGEAGAAAASRREFTLSQELEQLDARILRARLDIQRRVVAEFHAAWLELQRSGVIDARTHGEVAQQFRQSPGQAEALLPNGLIPGPTAYVFEYGMFAGRCALACLFVATFDTPYLLVALGLLVLNIYVIEPVVQKLYISTFNLLLASPGHKLVDLKRYVETHVPAGRVLRVPIIVPKFSSNPALNNLQAIIAAAARRSGLEPVRVVPFAIRDGRRDTVVEFASNEVPPPAPARLLAFRSALESEFDRQRAKFPLNVRVTAESNQLRIELLDDENVIWDLVGEDASQAFIYLRRNLTALRDTLTHVGPKLQPVFLFVSNTKDPDAIAYEVKHVAELQERSDREFGGQVGFLHLLRGGAWYNFNAYLQRFDASDKDFQRALPEFRRRFAEHEFAAKEYLLERLADGRSADDFARAFNLALRDPAFYEQFASFDWDTLPSELFPTAATFALLERARSGERLRDGELCALNRELLLTVVPARIRGDFFKKVGNDIAVHELIVAGQTKPTIYVSRASGEHVQDPHQPNFVRVWGDFARYTGLHGTNEQIQRAILAGEELIVDHVPEVAAIVDDKNEFGPGELEKGISIFLHPENRHIVIGVPRIDITLPEVRGCAMASEYILSARLARNCHNHSDGRSRAAVYSSSSAAYGKWLHRPTEYLAHYAREVLNPAHALSHDFQQSYLVAGAAGCLAGFSEALYGPTRFHARVDSLVPKGRVQPEPHGPRKSKPLAALLPARAESVMTSIGQQHTPN
ncbi:MAG TPA: hypothetical protein VFQ61_39085 [Polyangiaceae bacterium]|nr:hypothetical protein [Polyangiaceae bacterium]